MTAIWFSVSYSVYSVFRNHPSPGTTRAVFLGALTHVTAPAPNGPSFCFARCSDVCGSHLETFLEYSAIDVYKKRGFTFSCRLSLRRNYSITQ